MKKSKLIILLLIFGFYTGIGSYGQYTEIHCKHFLYGYPKGSPAYNDLIIRDNYALSSNDSTKFADWVAYRLDSVTISGPSQKGRKWAADPWLDDNETLEPDDYEGAPKALSIDRGHQAPLADFKGTNSAYETNYLSNITPQKSILNQGIWENLEEKERELTLKYGLVYVLTGTLYERPMPKLPKADEPHKVPSGYWKIIAIPSNRDISKPAAIEIFSFIFDQNTPKNDKLGIHLVSVDEIEKRSKLNFFSELEDNLENKLEKNPNPQFEQYLGE